MIAVSERDMGKEQVTAVTAPIGSGEITDSLSEAIPAFEEALAVYCGCEYGGATTKGTTGIQFAIAALNLNVGDFAKDLFALFNEFRAIHRCWPASQQFPPA